MLNREDIEEREVHVLSRLALKARDNSGRRVPEEPDALRTCFQRDRDRILHSAAFRRLQQKTQVFHAAEGDHFRTRLTHTLEVAQMARSACTSLGLNSDIAEAVALAHDLGHPPLGHAGERTLHARMQDHGGFQHNAQGLRVLDSLEETYAGRDGLNLCRETRLCLLKSRIPEGFPIADDLPRRTTPYLEGQLVDLCDRAAYLCHDMDDAMRSGLVDWEAFAALALPKEALARVRQRSPSLASDTTPSTSRTIRRETVGAMVTVLVRDLVVATDSVLENAHELREPNDVSATPSYLATHSTLRRTQISELLATLRQDLYRHPEVLRTMEQASEGIDALFDRFTANPTAMPDRFERRIYREGLERTVCDYIAGMTDRYVERSLAAGI